MSNLKIIAWHSTMAMAVNRASCKQAWGHMGSFFYDTLVFPDSDREVVLENT